MNWLKIPRNHVFFEWALWARNPFVSAETFELLVCPGQKKWPWFTLRIAKNPSTKQEIPASCKQQNKNTMASCTYKQSIDQYTHQQSGRETHSAHTPTPSPTTPQPCTIDMWKLLTQRRSFNLCSLYIYIYYVYLLINMHMAYMHIYVICSFHPAQKVTEPLQNKHASQIHCTSIHPEQKPKVDHMH